MKRLVSLKPEGRVVFVGDTHGQAGITKKIFETYVDERTKFVFLGDYINRGEKSKENVDTILDYKQQSPESVVMLAGNHEGYQYKPEAFRRTAFWSDLSTEDFIFYRELFNSLPLAASVGNVLATHGALPSLEHLEDFDSIELGSQEWNDTVWGDFKEGRYLTQYEHRPQFTEQYFNNAMKRYDREVLVRGHDPLAPLSMYGGKCVTLKTNIKKDVAIADFDHIPKPQTIHDFEIATV